MLNTVQVPYVHLYAFIIVKVNFIGGGVKSEACFVNKRSQKPASYKSAAFDALPQVKYLFLLSLLFPLNSCFYHKYLKQHSCNEVSSRNSLDVSEHCKLPLSLDLK